MVQLSNIFKENPSLIGAGVVAAGAFLHNTYAKVSKKNPNKKFSVTNALVSLSTMLAMIAKTSGSNLDWKARAIRIVGTGVATMIPAIYRTAVAPTSSKSN